MNHADLNSRGVENGGKWGKWWENGDTLVNFQASLRFRENSQEGTRVAAGPTWRFEPPQAKAGLEVFDTTALCRQARQAGYTLAVCHDLFVHHFGSRTFAHGGPASEH